MRSLVTMACTECKQRNYQTNKNKKNDPDRINIASSAKNTLYIKKLNNFC